jgi:hypothetical protein
MTGMIVYSRPRAAERSWFEEFDDLDIRGFVWRSDHGCSSFRKSACDRCGEEMEVRLFERRDVSYRVYVLCIMCGWWLEL